MTARDHNKLLSIFFLIHGALQVFGVVVAIIFLSYIANTVATSRVEGGGNVAALIVGGIIGVVIAAFLFVIPPLVAGYGMLKGKSWARMAGMVAGGISLIGFPLGTALGVYALWFLTNDEGKRLYLNQATQGYMPQSNSFNQ